jgi:hypothetical protein
VTIEDKAALQSDAGAGLARTALLAARMLLGVVLVGLVLLNVVNAVVLWSSASTRCWFSA